ncbi:MAG TPA: response regulator [Pyrinomonadaceae bacterium]|nr:response regulator [Pyrinomonadaceae bacterium]
MAGRKLLLADDSITIRKVVDLTFVDEGMEVTTVGNGAQAIQKLEEVSPDIVLVDIFMPGMSGYEVCEHIKRDERFRHIPVMLLVGSFEPFDEAEARRVGADDYLTKPFQSIRQLVKRVGALLGRAPEEEEATTRDLSLPPSLASPESELSREVLERSTADTAPLPKRVTEAIEEQQPEGGARRAHSNSSTSSSVASLKENVREDKMEESAPIEDFDSGADDHAKGQPQVAASPVNADFAELELETPRQERSSYDPLQETLSSFPAPEKKSSAVAAAAGGRAMGSSMARVALSDEALLELDEVLPGKSAAEADDFILDLQDDAFTMDAETLEEYEEELKAVEPEVGEFLEAQRAGDEQRADFATVEEPSMEAAAPAHTTAQPVMEEAVRPPAIEPALESPAAAATTTPTATATAAADIHSQPMGQITLSQLSPEVIDAIARRAVEQISDRVIEEVAWEVVPQLAELLIRRHLEREKTGTQ